MIEYYGDPSLLRRRRSLGSSRNLRSPRFRPTCVTINLPTCNSFLCSAKQRHPQFRRKHRANNTMEEMKIAVRDNLNTNPGKEVRVHLFNCDKTYNLNSVVELFGKVKDDIREKLNFDIELPIGKNYFPLSKMSEMCETTIHKLQMDFAVFVVHANESRLSINEDNAGIGYATIYRALLKATGKSSVYSGS